MVLDGVDHCHKLLAVLIGQYYRSINVTKLPISATVGNQLSQEKHRLSTTLPSFPLPTLAQDPHHQAGGSCCIDMINHTISWI